VEQEVGGSSPPNCTTFQWFSLMLKIFGSFCSLRFKAARIAKRNIN
jgi:hypothetical protein